MPHAMAYIEMDQSDGDGITPERGREREHRLRSEYSLCTYIACIPGSQDPRMLSLIIRESPSKAHLTCLNNAQSALNLRDRQQRRYWKQDDLPRS